MSRQTKLERGAAHYCVGNRLAWNPRQQRLKLFSGIWERHRAGAGPAPTAPAAFAELGAARRAAGSSGLHCPHTRRMGAHQGGVAGGVPPHKGGPKARPSRTADARTADARCRRPGTVGGRGTVGGDRRRVSSTTRRGRSGVRGALRGESPRTREGRRPDRPKGYRKGYSSTLPMKGPWTGRGAIATRGIGTCTPVPDSILSMWWQPGNLRAKRSPLFT